MKIETKACRYGTMTYFADDEFVGKSLKLYGEFSDPEVDVMAKTVRPGDTVIDVGANVGALTVAMARLVGPTGRVIAFEPQPETASLLERNAAQNGLDNVEIHRCAAGDKLREVIAMPNLAEVGHKNYGGVALGKGERSVTTETIDDMKLESVSFIKIDVEGMERQVIKGARETIKRCRPFLYVENDRPEHSNRLVSDIVDLGYRLYWHRPLLFSEKNWRKEERNVFGGIISINMICVPEELNAAVTGSDEVGDLRMDPTMYERELERYQRISRNNPKDVLAQLQVIHYLNLTRKGGDALALADQVILDTDNPGARTLRGMISLQNGVWDWDGYESRYLQKNTQTFGGHHKPDLPQWDGKLTRERVHIWCEQGFGDSIMFCRFITEALKRAPQLILEVQPQLFELFEVSGIVPLSRLFRLNRELPKCKYHCSLPSLGKVLGVDAAMVKKHSQSYLFAEDAMAKVWQRKGTPKIGLCCKGSPRSERPYTRDIDASVLKTVADAYGPLLTLDNVGQFESFADTAAAISAVDLVISVDTSVAHLAGAMGKPVWLLLSHDPDWRWGLDGDETIWYPTMRIFRQPKLFDWKLVVENVMASLDEAVKSKAA
jgi:FkbM family methyltransferase